ncbi:MAG: MFS transporter [Turicibacter sp.]|nr:MFS transporter [Turicibacter sp.]
MKPLFYAVAALFWMSLYTYMPYITPYSEELGADLRMIGLIVGSYGITQMLIRFPLGIFADRVQKYKIFIIIGLFLAALSGFLIFIFPNPIVMLIIRSLSGVTAATWVTFTILGSAYYKADETIKAVGYLNTANGLGRTIALFAGTIFAGLLGFSYAFLLGGIVAFLAFLLSFGIVEKKPSVKPPKTIELLQIVKRPMLLYASVMAILSQYITFATTFGFVPLVAVQMGADNFQLGALVMVATLPNLLISPLMWRISKKLGARTTIAICFILATVGVIIVPFSTALWQLFMAQLLGTAGTAGLMTLLMGLAIQDIPSHTKATAMGFFQAVYGIGMFLGPFIMGQIAHNFGILQAFISTSLIGTLGLLLIPLFNLAKPSKP